VDRQYVACIEVSCTVRAQMKTRPALITPSGDGSLYVTGITWRGWDTSTAIGTGTAHANNCTPNCAQGTFANHPATITLTSPRYWHGDMAYTRETVHIPAIHDRFTLRTGLLPGPRPSSPPVVTQPTTPGPVSTSATLAGSCVMGYEPAYDAGGTIAYGPFIPGTPIRYTRIGSIRYTPATAYQVTLTNNGSATARATGWAVAFYGRSGGELGSDDEPYGANDTFITAGQSLTWTMYSGNDTHGLGLSGSAVGQQDDNIPSDGTAATCTFLTWYNG
jgi:hypothetical protein